jgi:tetratricopeptide (TPR) repeat protein
MEKKDEHSEASAAVPPREFLKAARSRLMDGEQRQAYRILRHARDLHPRHPLIVSYFGWLEAMLDRKYASGIAGCRKAFALFTSSNPGTMRAVYPVLYLNLGRAFLCAGRKKEAVESFSKGLAHDKNNRDLKRELERLGLRKDPPVSFLPRSNPINKYVGMLLRPASRSSRSHLTRCV